MGRNINEVIAALPKPRRDRIEAKARGLARAMTDHADSLGKTRKAIRKKQPGIAPPGSQFGNKVKRKG